MSPLFTDEPRPPDAVFVRQRMIPQWRVDWAMRCNEILMEHGSVHGSQAYPDRHLARWRAQSLIKLLTELRLHERWQLSEHVTRHQDGYRWSVEYIRRPDDASIQNRRRPRQDRA